MPDWEDDPIAMIYLASIGIVLTVLTLWIAVQHAARVFAARHPEFGPAREEGESCGGLLCLCKKRKTCPNRQSYPESGSGPQTEG